MRLYIWSDAVVALSLIGWPKADFMAHAYTSNACHSDGINQGNGREVGALHGEHEVHAPALKGGCTCLGYLEQGHWGPELHTSPNPFIATCAPRTT